MKNDCLIKAACIIIFYCLLGTACKKNKNKASQSSGNTTPTIPDLGTKPAASIPQKIQDYINDKKEAIAQISRAKSSMPTGISTQQQATLKKVIAEYERNIKFTTDQNIQQLAQLITPLRQPVFVALGKSRRDKLNEKANTLSPSIANYEKQYGVHIKSFPSQTSNWQ